MGTTGGGDSKQREACDTSGGVPPQAAPSRAGMPPRRLSAEVSAAVDEFNWPPILSREWTPSASPNAGGVVGAPNVGALEEGGAGVGLAADTAGGGGGGGKRLKVLTWNVLCDGLSGSHPEKGGFLMAPEGSLDWDKRRWKLLEEILRWDCDVLVLQEVDHHHDWLSPMLAKEGYRSLFVKKPIAPGLTFSPSLEDGCSLFYRVSVPAGDGGAGASGPRGEGGDPEQGKSASEKTTLDLLDAHTFTYAIDETEEGREEKGMQGEGVEGGGSKKSESNSDTAAAAAAAAADKKVSQNQVAMISLLSVSAGCGGGNGSGNGGGRNGDGESLVVVATTHLKASKDKRGEVMRSRQAQQLLDEVTRFREGHERGRGLPSGSIPLVIAGDFNAAPHRSKAGSDGYEPLCFRQVTAHPLALRSAFPLKGAFTTWKIRPGPRRVAPVAEAGGGVEASAEAGATTGAGGQGGGKESSARRRRSTVSITFGCLGECGRAGTR